MDKLSTKKMLEYAKTMNMTRVNTDVILQNEHKYAVIPKIFDKSFGQKRDQIGAKWRPDPGPTPPSRVPAPATIAAWSL